MIAAALARDLEWILLFAELCAVVVIFATTRAILRVLREDAVLCPLRHQWPKWELKGSTERRVCKSCGASQAREIAIVAAPKCPPHEWGDWMDIKVTAYPGVSDDGQTRLCRWCGKREVRIPRIG